MSAGKHLQPGSARLHLHAFTVSPPPAPMPTPPPQLDQYPPNNTFKKLQPKIIYCEMHNRNHNIYNVLQSHQISGEGINCPGSTLK